MTELAIAAITSLLHNPTVIAVFGSVVGALIWGFHQRLAGAKAERSKRAAEEAHARDIADKVQNDVSALPADAAKEELKSWSKE
jgi:hypothetical protein